MSMIGLLGILVAFAAVVISVGCFGIGWWQRKHAERADNFFWGGRVAVLVAAVSLTLCCAILVWCFMTGDNTIEYVLRYRSGAEGELGWLYRLSGLWAGRQGSLLFWAWLISLFNVVVLLATRKKGEALDNMALLVSQVVLGCFVGVLLFSADNMPFKATDAIYFDASGALRGAALTWGMNNLLEHWAMAIHPPTLFIGYAGLTIPFAYAIATLVANNEGDLWVRRATPYTMFSWLLLGIGIGLGAVWAYVVLGWGGYWGWDPVENASLLPWLVCVALVHSFTLYRQRGIFKKWAIMCACLAFSFVILGTFITRSGLVQSVHSFNGDPVSTVLFLVLIVASLLAGAVGLLLRRKGFAAGNQEDIDSLYSRDAAYYVNNLIMIVFAVLLAYMTISAALPSFLPFGGQSLSAGTYNAIARPLGIVYCLLIAVCPLLGWGRTDGKAFFRKARIPGICAIVLFIVLMVYFCTYLLPSYNAMLAVGGETASGLLEQGPSWYYNGLAVVGFAVASLLFFNAGYMVVRTAARLKGALRRRLALLGGSVAHLAMAVILVGLIGSSMYVTSAVGYLEYDEESNTAAPMVIQDFELRYVGQEDGTTHNGPIFTVTFDVYRDGQYVGQVSPSREMSATTMQTKSNAGVIGFPLEDLFVVFSGITDEGSIVMEAKVNPLISFVWAGFGMLILGTLTALFASRRPQAKTGANEEPELPASADGK
ncbi:heme lyase CcmF/NrfE family subunit [Parvibacter caecicola]|uniref:heme lyase CcmF/NrfE family subunit n=1 Tax=Parvibacter caecicola TaxID=747645 RepID=UPI0023F3451A|nr:cytochrome c biogenesis protein CcsA [Parvibacter caecicola]